MITIEDDLVLYKSQKFSVPEFCQLTAQHTPTGLETEPLPDGVKWLAQCRDKRVYILELQPGLQYINWHGTHRTVATPYVVMKVPIHYDSLFRLFRMSLCGNVEVFYRNEPLRSLDDPLYHSNLLNVADSGSDTDWVCLGKNVFAASSYHELLENVVHALWGAEFNGDVDSNGYPSWHRRYQAVPFFDERVTDIARWAKASQQDPNFVLGVEWLKADATPRSLIQKHLGCVHVSRTSQLGNFILQG